MRIFLYKNGNVVKTNAGLKSVEEHEFQKIGRKLINEYMVAVAPEFWNEPTPMKEQAIKNLEVWQQTNELRQAHVSQKNSEKGNLQKSYFITPFTKRHIQCAAINAYENRHNKLTFVTLTQNLTKDERESNKWVSKLLDNLKKNYGLISYVGTLEHQKNGQPHYHFLFDMPFTYWNDINSAWNNATNTIAFTPNMVRTRKGFAIVNSVDGIVRYITKYISKETAIFRARNYFISRNLLSGIRNEVEQTVINLILKQKKCEYKRTSQGVNFETGYITNYLDRDISEKRVKKVRNARKIHRRKQQKTIQFSENN